MQAKACFSRHPECPGTILFARSPFLQLKYRPKLSRFYFSEKEILTLCKSHVLATKLACAKNMQLKQRVTMVKKHSSNDIIRSLLSSIIPIGGVNYENSKELRT